MASTKIYRTFTSGNTDKWTWSAWVKRGTISATQGLFAGHVDDQNRTDIKINGSDQFVFEHVVGNSYVSRHISNRLFRDTGAWYHFVVVWDTGNASEHERQRLYVNGVEENSWSTATNCAQDTDNWMNNTASTSVCNIGIADANNFEGIMSHVQFVDGLALAPTEFGETDATTGEWKIKPGSYATPGTNGFHLKFEDSANLDLDSSSNALSFTTSGSLIQTEDNPDNNFANMGTPTWFDGTRANTGNTITTNSSARWYQGASIGLKKGKWYWEVKLSTIDEYALVGITSNPSPYDTTSSDWILGSGTYDYAVYTGDGSTGGGNGHMYNNAGAAPGNAPGQFMAAISQGDILTFALDCDNNTLKVGANGQWANGSNATNQTFANTTAKAITAVGSTNTRFYHPAGGDYGGTNVYQFNFGDGYFGTTAVSTAQADDGALGVFEYDVPAGYRAICTKNLNTYG